MTDMDTTGEHPECDEPNCQSCADRVVRRALLAWSQPMPMVVVDEHGMHVEMVDHAPNLRAQLEEFEI